MKNANIWIYILLLACSIFIYFLRMPYHRVPILIVDEAYYAEVANRMLDGDISYRDNKPPGIFFLYGAVFRLFGKNNLYAVHIVVTLCHIFTAFMLFVLLQPLIGRYASALASVCHLLLPSFSTSVSNYYAANTEYFMIFFVMISFLCFMNANNRFLLLFLAGFFAGLSVLFKQQGFFIFLMLIALTFIADKKKSTAIRIRQSSFIFAGFFVPAGMVAVFYAMHGDLYTLIYNIFLVNTMFLTEITLLNGLYLTMKSIYAKLFSPSGLIYFTAGIQFLFYCMIFFKSRYRQNTTLFLISWSVVAAVNLSIGWRFSGHYYLMIYPVLAYWFALFWRDGILFIRKKLSINKYLPVIAGIILLFSIGYPLVAYTGFPPGSKMYTTYLDQKDSIGQQLKHVSHYVLAHTNKEDTLFVWGFAPELYVLSHRHSASRHVHCNYIAGEVCPYRFGPHNHTATEKYLDELVYDLTASSPAYIIDISPSGYLGFKSHPISAYPKLYSFITSNYFLEKRIGNIDLYRLLPVSE